MVIVTKNQYLLASKIHHITLDEQINYIDNPFKRGTTIKESSYVIQIIYAPESLNTQNSGPLRSNDEYRECNVTIRTAVNAHKVFMDLIQQIREQMPDQLYLDTALERMISSVDMASLIDRDAEDRDDDKGFWTLPRGKMTENQKRLVKLELQKESVKKFYEDFNEALMAVKAEVGINGYFQDESDGTVFKIVEPDGRYITYDKVSYTRTRRLSEERSPLPLALKEAEAAGFNVPKK